MARALRCTTGTEARLAKTTTKKYKEAKYEETFDEFQRNCGGILNKICRSKTRSFESGKKFDEILSKFWKIFRKSIEKRELSGCISLELAFLFFLKLSFL